MVKSKLEEFMDTPESDNLDNLVAESVVRDVQNESDGKAETLCAHVSGKAVPLESVGDEVFSTKILGDGCAVEPEEGRLYSPCDGKVEGVFDTKHAVNLTSDSGAEILLHIGIDTVKLGGKYFKSFVKQGQSVKKGDLLITFDMDGIKRDGYKLTTPMIVCNSGSYKRIRSAVKGKIGAGEKLLELD